VTATTEPGGFDRRKAMAIALIVLNLALLGLNLDKRGLLPFVGDGQETTADSTESLETATPASGSDTSTVPVEEAGEEEAAAMVDDWPGGHGPVPEGPPVQRRVLVNVDGFVLTGSSPDWATATRIADDAAANAPAGVIVDNQLTWHPDATDVVQSGMVLIEQAATFEPGSLTVEAASFPTLDFAAEILKSRPGIFAVVVGHPDNVGDPPVNAEDAVVRAEAVVEYLVAAGALPAQIVVAAADEDGAPAANDPASDQATDGRVEIHFRNFLVDPDGSG